MNLVASLLERSIRRVIVFVERHPWFSAFVVVAFVGVRLLFAFAGQSGLAVKLAGLLTRLFVAGSELINRLPYGARVALDVVAFVMFPVPFLIWWAVMDTARQGFIAGGSNLSAGSPSSSSEQPGGTLPNESEPGPFEPGGEFDPFTYKF